ncbi:MAG: branched-chain amino acid ABC transporter permease [Candidatus Eremiobacteraeota bacterium]|nr:branched-chain amino acid ABC transporter permease [Candidatus Eremiobacteraeota bacterium]
MWLDQILQGVLLGGYYALLACGLSFMFGVMRIVNLAHGSIAVLSAFVVLSIAEAFHISPFLALVVALPIMAAAGWLLQVTILERSLRSGSLTPLLSTFGLAVVLDNAMFQKFGANTHSLDIGDLAFASWNVTPDIAIGQLALLTFVVAVALLGGLQLFLSRTPLGRAIRATSEDPDTAELVGIDSRRAYAAAAAIAIATVAIAGTFLAMRATFDPYTGPTQLIFAFEAVVIGGTGSLWGTLIGGIALGVAQNIGSQISPQGFLIAGHAVFFVVLAARFFIAGRDPRTLIRALRRAPA